MYIGLEAVGFTGVIGLATSLVVALMIYFGLSRSGCDFTLQILRILFTSIISTVAGGLSNSPYSAEWYAKQIPMVMKTVLSRFESILDDKVTIYATCPSCSCLYAPSDKIANTGYVAKCENTRTQSSSTCNADLLEKKRPIRPFVLPCFYQYISKLLSNKEIETYLDKACEVGLDAARGSLPDPIVHPFQASFVRNLKGPDQEHLFIDGGSNREARLIFGLNVDWFNFFRSTNRGVTTSTGVLILSCLNLPLHLRDKPEYMFVAVIPGPHSPPADEINHFLRPVIDAIRCSYYRGLQFNRTANFPHGRIVRCTIGPIVCDLPAARKIAGIASYNTVQKFCSRCSFDGKDTNGSNNHGVCDHPALDPNVKLHGISFLDEPPVSSDHQLQHSQVHEPAEITQEEEEDLIRFIDSIQKSEHDTQKLKRQNLKSQRVVKVSQSDGLDVSEADGGMESGKKDKVLQKIIEKITPPQPYSGWTSRPVRYMKMQSLSWKTVGTAVRQKSIWNIFGIRDSDLWRLPPTWDPVKQLVFDPMHCFLEGVVQFHFREVLHISEEFSIKPQMAFSLDIRTEELDIKNSLEGIQPSVQAARVRTSVLQIAKRLTESIQSDVDGDDKKKRLADVLADANKSALWHVAKELGLLDTDDEFKRVNRTFLAQKLIAWVGLHYFQVRSS
jgi:hypothetical protein